METTNAVNAMFTAPIRVEFPFSLKEWDQDKDRCLEQLKRFEGILKNAQYSVQYGVTSPAQTDVCWIELETRRCFGETLDAAIGHEQLIRWNYHDTILITICGY